MVPPSEISNLSSVNRLTLNGVSERKSAIKSMMIHQNAVFVLGIKEFNRSILIRNIKMTSQS